MKAIRIHEPIGISGLVYEEAPDATPMIGDVLVKVAACGITHNELDRPLWTMVLCRVGCVRRGGPVCAGQTRCADAVRGCPCGRAARSPRARTYSGQRRRAD